MGLLGGGSGRGVPLAMSALGRGLRLGLAGLGGGRVGDGDSGHGGLLYLPGGWGMGTIGGGGMGGGSPLTSAVMGPGAGPGYQGGGR